MAEIDANSFSPEDITRPSAKLMAYYFVSSLLLGPFFFVALIPFFFRYKTMRFTFDGQGVTLKYGAFFQTEKRLNYRRIQDIHLTRGVLQRRFGLANVSLFTASGSAGPEMTLEGIPDPDALRDFLYLWSRSAREGKETDGQRSDSRDDEVSRLLVEIRDALRASASGGGAAS